MTKRKEHIFVAGSMRKYPLPPPIDVCNATLLLKCFVSGSSIKATLRLWKQQHPDMKSLCRHSYSVYVLLHGSGLGSPVIASHGIGAIGLKSRFAQNVYPRELTTQPVWYELLWYVAY